MVLPLAPYDSLFPYCTSENVLNALLVALVVEEEPSEVEELLGGERDSEVDGAGAVVDGRVVQLRRPQQVVHSRLQGVLP